MGHGSAPGQEAKIPHATQCGETEQNNSDPEEDTHAGDKSREERGRKDQKKKTSLAHLVLGLYEWIHPSP